MNAHRGRNETGFAELRGDVAQAEAAAERRAKEQQRWMIALAVAALVVAVVTNIP